MYLTEDQETELTKLEKFLKKEGRNDLIQGLKGATLDEMNAKLLGYAKHAQEIIDTKNRDEELKNARQRVKVLNEPYREQLNMNKKLARYTALVIKDEEGRNGMDVDSDV